MLKHMIYLILSSYALLLMWFLMSYKRAIQTNKITGLPHMKQMILDLNTLVRCNKKEHFTILVYKFSNIGTINRYVSFSTGEKALRCILSCSLRTFGNHRHYSLCTDEIAVIVRGCTMQEVIDAGNAFLKSVNRIFEVDGVCIRTEVIAGVIHYPLHGRRAEHMIQKLERSLEQVDESRKHEVVLYDDEDGHKTKQTTLALMEIHSAMKRGAFFLVFQPKMSMSDSRIIGAEVLLRINEEMVETSIGGLISLAERSGLICQITRWVIEQTIVQMAEWSRQGIEMPCSVNVSSKDLDTEAMVFYAKKKMKAVGLKPQLLEFELTETSIIENEARVADIFGKMQSEGFSVSIDDFGTGHNSLKNMLALPFDVLKIDKFFIDNICDTRYQIVVGSMISAAHALGKYVVAEGVEEKKQFDIMKLLNCDAVQGYYCYRPMKAEQIEMLLRPSTERDAIHGGTYEFQYNTV